MLSYETRVRKLLINNDCKLITKENNGYEIWFCAKTNKHIAVDCKIRSRRQANNIMKLSGDNHEL